MECLILNSQYFYGGGTGMEKLRPSSHCLVCPLCVSSEIGVYEY